jgi:hypothetical protein
MFIFRFNAVFVFQFFFKFASQFRRFGCPDPENETVQRTFFVHFDLSGLN